MSEFRFKRFSVTNERSAMKVNTDGVLLGALMTLRPDDRMLLDVGTGTGTIALMAAQRLSDMGLQHSAHIVAIDIDAPSAAEASANFIRSPWPQMLSAENVSLEGLAFRMASAGYPPGTGLFDHVFSNPPYFETELKSPDLRRREARHAGSLSYREMLDFAARWLSPGGRCSMILPCAEETGLCRHARMCGLFPHRIVRISTVPEKPPRRIVAEFARPRPETMLLETLAIQEKGRYTDQYTSLMSPFYIWARP